jgi:hypothetical protein
MRSGALKCGLGALVERFQRIEEAWPRRLAHHRHDLRPRIDEPDAGNQAEIPVGQEMQQRAAAMQEQQRRHQQRLRARAVVRSQDERVQAGADMLHAVDGHDMPASEQRQSTQQHAIAEPEMGQGAAHDPAAQERLPWSRRGLYCDGLRELGSSHGRGSQALEQRCVSFNQMRDVLAAARLPLSLQNRSAPHTTRKRMLPRAAITLRVAKDRLNCPCRTYAPRTLQGDEGLTTVR